MHRCRIVYIISQDRVTRGRKHAYGSFAGLRWLLGLQVKVLGWVETDVEFTISSTFSPYVPFLFTLYGQFLNGLSS